MPRRLLPLASLLLCAAVVALWVRSYRIHDRFGVSTSRARYTLHSDHGRLVLTRPPDPGPQTALAWQMASRISNRDVCFEPYARVTLDDGTFGFRLQRHIRRNSDTWAMYDKFSSLGGMQSSGMKSAAGPLLMALDDPNRVIAAHNELMFLSQGRLEESSRVHGEEVTVNVDGLPVICRVADFPTGLMERDPNYFLSYRGPFGRADASTWRSLRDRWHDRLDVPILSLSDGWVVALAALLPLVWAWRQWRRWSALRRNVCPECGYDLRASPDCCPECGTPVRTPLIAS